MAPRREYSAGDRTELWQRWRRGDRITDIAEALRREPGSIYTHLLKSGGIEPSARRRHQRVLSLSERETISRGIAAGASMRAIARELGRAPSNVCREIKRNGGKARFRASVADARAWSSAKRPKHCKLATHGRLRHLVATKLRADWSPEQVSGWLKLRYPNDASMNISHEAIYRSLFVQTRGALRRELVEHLRAQRRFRQSVRRQPSQQGRIVDAASIRERPPEVADRAIPGHWEGDLLVGAASTHIATLVERTSRLTMLVKIDRKDAETVRKALAKQIRRLPDALARSLTWDRGTELAQHAQLSIDAGLDVYFCDPHSPWQRGTNENTNRLLRQYFPKGTRLDDYTQAQLNRTAHQLNTRPRKTLGYRTPLETFAGALP